MATKTTTRPAAPPSNARRGARSRAEPRGGSALFNCGAPRITPRLRELRPVPRRGDHAKRRRRSKGRRPCVKSSRIGGDRAGARVAGARARASAADGRRAHARGRPGRRCGSIEATLGRRPHRRRSPSCTSEVSMDDHPAVFRHPIRRYEVAVALRGRRARRRRRLGGERRRDARVRCSRWRQLPGISGRRSSRCYDPTRPLVRRCSANGHPNHRTSPSSA